MENETRTDRFFSFIERHKVAIAVTVSVTATLAVAIVANRQANNDMMNFIKERDLYDEYLTDGEE